VVAAARDGSLSWSRCAQSVVEGLGGQRSGLLQSCVQREVRPFDHAVGDHVSGSSDRAITVEVLSSIR